ncbi:ribulose-phosphate 3-epimerase, partial [Candidatus Micrarchaeota archaeon]|nr:ribulose-phosphate 3-epimerase [Candidatus Micrarchaeota archaeon]
MKIIPSLLAASRNWSKAKVQLVPLVRKKLVNSVHVDVMDGEFVSNYTLDWLNAELVRKLRKAFPALFIEVHLMVQNPESYAEQFVKAGANRIWWHIEAEKNKKELEKMKRKWKRVEFSPAINPETGADKLKSEKFSCVLVMSVHPGKGGQKFIKYALKKIEKIKRKYPCAIVSVDG